MPAAAQHLEGLRQEFLVYLSDVVLLGFQMHHEVDSDEVQKRRNHRRDHHVDVAGLEELRHDERRGAHDGRRDLAAGRCAGLDRRGELRAVTDVAHERNREGTRSDDVGDGRARYRAHESARHRRSLGRPANPVTGKRNRQVDKKSPSAGTNQQRAEDDEQHDVSGTDVQWNTEDPIAAHEQRVDKLLKPDRGAVEKPEEVISVERVGDEEPGNDYHRPTDRPACRLEHQHDEYAADDDVGKLLFTVAHVKCIDIVERPDLDEQHQNDQSQINRKSEPAQSVSAITWHADRLPARGPE